MLCFEPLSLDIAFSLVMCFSFSPVVFFPPFFLFTNTWLYLLVSWYSQNIERKYTMTQIFFPLRLTAITDSNLPVTASQVHFLVNQNSKVCSWHQQGVSTTNMLTTKQNWTEMRFIKCLLLAFRARLRDKYVIIDVLITAVWLIQCGFSVDTQGREIFLSKKCELVFYTELGVKGQTVHRWVT